MSKTITSGGVAFIDLTDSRKLEAYITSNLPTTQIYNQNTQIYTPDWGTTNLQLSADIYLDAKAVTSNSYTSIIWYKKVGTQSKTQVGTGASLTINSNQLIGSVGIITYICEATYNDTSTNPPTAHAEIVFTRVDAGLNGSDGTDAPAVVAQYSADGSSWTSTLNTATHKYIRYSYDGGKTYTTAIKMVGEDGTSVRILGTATSATKVSNTDYYTLVYSSAAITGATLGDAYLYNGNLYVCADSRDGQDYFINVGNIQGPSGNDGKSSYVFIRYATDANGTNMSTSPSGKTYIGVYTSDTNIAPTTASSYTWSKFVGDNAKNIILTGDSQVFKISANNIITPGTIKVTAQTFNTTVTNWTYSTNGGQTFLSTVPTGVSRSGNIVTITGSTITSNSIVIKASDGEVSDVFTIYKAIDGADGSEGQDGAPAPMAFLTNENITFSANTQGQIIGTTIISNIVAYEGSKKVTPVLRKNTDGTPTITGIPNGMSIASSEISASNEIMLTITIANNSTLGSTSSNMGTIGIPITYPVSTVLYLTWSKVNTGATGVGIKSTTVTYGVSDSASTKPADIVWQSTVPTVEEGKYLWTRTIIDYTDNTVADTVTYTYTKQGTKGDTGSTGSSVTVSSIQYQEGTSATIPPTGTWSDSIIEVAEGKYLWTKTAFSDGNNAYGVVRHGTAAITFQVYAPNGYVFTKDLPSLTLQTFAYEGSTDITSNVTYQWAQYVEDDWEDISGATAQTLTVTKDEVVKSKSYKCTMTYKSKQYIATATVQDKTDTYYSLIQVTTKYSSTNKPYWVLYSTVYSDEGERDALLGPISATAPENPTTGQYWYKIDETNYTVILMKYSGIVWAETTDKQALVYDWSLFNDTSQMISLGAQNKVKIITSSNFSKTCSVQCNIRGAESILISSSNQTLIDSGDPIVSSIEPTNPTHGQLWIKIGTNGSYTLLAWDASLKQWIISEADARAKVHISKPLSYEIGDVWVVGSDYEPTIYINGVAQTTKHLAGTMLKAQYSSQAYQDSDWVEALNYKNDINDLKENLNMYNQFFGADEDGLVMQAKDQNGVISEFKTKLTHTELGFYQGENKVAHINNNQLNISKAEITNGMTITGTTPVLEIGNFIIIQESNGSLSIGSKG